MAERVHIAVTRRVRKECVGDFERAFSKLARRPLLELVKIAHGWLYPKNKVSKYS
jgi:hypothetical protein